MKNIENLNDLNRRNKKSQYMNLDKNLINPYSDKKNDNNFIGKKRKR
jgi:hypothetical protein